MKKKRLKSLTVGLPLLFVISVIIIMIVVVPLVYHQFYSRMIDQYTRMAKGVTQLMVNAFDGDKAEEYMEKNFDLPEYVEIVDYFYTLRDNYPDILYMYVYRFEEDGGHVIIDPDADWWDNGEGYEPGYVYETEEPFTSHLQEVMEGKEIAGYSELTREDGYLFTYTRPIFHSDGSYACTACVDFSMDYLSGVDTSFTIRLALILLCIGVVVLILDIVIVRRRITLPIRRLSQCAGAFCYDTEEDRKNNLRLLDTVNIRTGDEIEDVYHMLQSVTHDSFRATSNLIQAQNDMRSKDGMIARLLIAYAIKIRKPFKALAIMGMGLTVAYGLLLRMHTAVPALITLGLFSFSVAGVYPIAVACTGSMMSSASVGLMLAIGGIGGIAFPWLVGIIADAIGLRNGMAINLIPCVGMIVVPVILMGKRKSEDPQ